LEAGDRIVRRDFPEEALPKDDRYLGHHAIVTKADLISQNVILHLH
jgi:hypothetical protein